MAKKARRRLEELETVEAFRFPDFDERKFLAHEYEQSRATFLVLLIAILLALACWGYDRLAGPAALGWGIGLVGVVGTPFLVSSLRPLSKDYTKGDWAWLILTTFMGWIGLWFLLLNLAPA